MKIFLLSNPLDAAIKAKIIGGGQINITEFPVMELNEMEQILFRNVPFAPNYIRLDNDLFRVVCIVVGEFSEMYITKEKGQIIDFVKPNQFDKETANYYSISQSESLQFINFTQIQTISLKMGIPLKQ